MKKLLLSFLLLTLFVTPCFAKSESESKDAQSVVAYGQVSSGVIAPLKVDSSGVMQADSVGWIDGNVVNCDGTTNAAVSTCIAAASNYDTLKTISGTVTCTGDIDVDKPIFIDARGTTFNSTAVAGHAFFNITSSNVTVEGGTFTHTAIVTSGIVVGLLADGVNSATGNIITNVNFRNPTCIFAGSGNFPRYCVQYKDASGTTWDATSLITATSTNNIFGIYATNEATAEAATTVNVFNSKSITGSGATGANNGIIAYDNSSANDVILNIYGGYYEAVAGAGSSEHAIQGLGGDAIVNVYGATANGATYDVISTTSAVVTVYNAELLNNTYSGIVFKDWRTWSPTFTCASGTAPETPSVVARYSQIGNQICFNLYAASTDGNDCAGMEVSLPVVPKDINSYTPINAYEYQNASYVDTFQTVIDQLDNTPANRTLIFGNFTTCTNDQTCTVNAAGCYEAV